MELKKYKFNVSTADKCFLCFAKADFNHCNSLGNILHCLKINLTELHSLSSKSPSLLNKTDFKIRLCIECGLIIQKLSKEYETLQVYKMKVASTLEVIKKRLTQDMPESVTEEDTKFLKHCKIVEELRSEMVKKCGIKIDQVLPKVRIEKINLKDVEMKQKKVSPVLSESAPIVALEVKSEITYESDNFEEDSIFNSEAETFETVSTPAKTQKIKEPLKKRIKSEKMIARKTDKKKHYKKELPNQMKWQRGNRPCPLCQLIFTSRLKLRYHLRTHVKEKCFLCRKIFPSQELLNLHLKQHETNNAQKTSEAEFSFNCEICGEKINTPTSLLSHKKSHKNPDELFYCNFCGAGCKSEDRLRIHQERVHSDKNLPCSICSRTFLLALKHL